MKHCNVPIHQSLFEWADFQSATFNFNQPFSLRLLEGEILQARTVVRLLPKLRMVVFGQWQGKPVVAKLFFDAHHAKRHCEADAKGMKNLHERKIPAPKLYYQGASEDRRVHVLIFEKIEHAESAQTVWENRRNFESILPQASAMLVEIAMQHVVGVLQQDLHFNNFLIKDKIVYTLDGGQVALFPYLLPKKESMDNLALFLAQFGVGNETYQRQLFLDYAKLRGWIVKKEDVSELFLLIKRINEKRWKKFSKKILRNSSGFLRIKTWRALTILDRRYQSEEMLQLLADPEAAFQSPDRHMLKDGRSSTVIKVTVSGRALVIKRYNLKNKRHWLRRCLRPTRAANVWRLAHKLALFCIQTAEPVAFIEKSYFGLRSVSYYVTEYVSGMQVNDYIAAHQSEEAKLTDMVYHVTALLKSLAKIEMTHCDLKASNILLNHQALPVLIDLDGAMEHYSLFGLHQAWQKEIARFLKNFKADSFIMKKFQETLYSR